MLFNIDNESKQRMFNQSKQDAEEYIRRKQMEKQKKIQEETEYLAQSQMRENIEEERKRNEKMQKKNAQMEYYQRMMNNHNFSLKMD